MTLRYAGLAGTAFNCPSIRPINPFQWWSVLLINLQGNMDVCRVGEFDRNNGTGQGGS